MVSFFNNLTPYFWIYMHRTCNELPVNMLNWNKKISLELYAYIDILCQCSSKELENIAHSLKCSKVYLRNAKVSALFLWNSLGRPSPTDNFVAMLYPLGIPGMWVHGHQENQTTSLHQWFLSSCFPSVWVNWTSVIH